MNTEKKIIRNEAKVFKDICKQLSKASGVKYDTVVLKVLQTKYGKLISEPTLEEVGYIFNVTRERVRQYQEEAIGKRSADGTITKKGKLLTPEFQRIFKGLIVKD